MGMELFVRGPSWLSSYKAADQTPHYAYLKKLLQVLQWQRGGARWVLKTSMHLEQLRPLTTVFPDVTVVMTHRDPVSIVASLSTMIAYSARLSDRKVDLAEIARYWGGRIYDQLRRCVDDHDVVPSGQCIDVVFQEFMKDDVATVRRIYEVAEQPLPESSLRALHDYMDAHPRGRHGRVLYDLADFGLDRAELREKFRFYTDRFGVELESQGERE
jgi:hypothetical protein